jgi:hypothetical protein
MPRSFTEPVLQNRRVYIDVREEWEQVSTTKSPTRLTYAGNHVIT